MNASQLQNITLTPNPRTGLARRADLLTFTWDAETSQIKQKYRVFELDLQGERLSYSVYEVRLYASNAWLINPATGEVMTTQEEVDEIAAAYNTALIEYNSAVVKYGSDLIEYNNYLQAVTNYNTAMAALQEGDNEPVQPTEVSEPVVPTAPTDNRVTGLMGEYDFFLLYAENPIELYPLLLSKTLAADSDKQRFDR